MATQEAEVEKGSDMMKEVARLNAEKRGIKIEDAELPQGSSKVAKDEETAVDETETSEETSEAAEGEAVVEPAAEEEPIRIAGREFKTQKEAFAYAEELELNNKLSEAHNAGVREALESQARASGVGAAAQPEDDFDARFYANPKETLKQLKEDSKREAFAMMQAERNKENLWSEFLSENPDIRRKDAERILQENWDTIGKLTDMAAGKRLLAQKVRSEYDEIIETRKPRTTLSEKKAVVSPSGGGASGVTPKKKEDSPLSFTEQMRKLNKRS